MTGTIKSPRSATLNMKGVSVRILQKFLNELPVEAQKSGQISVSSTPGDRPFEGSTESLRVSWTEDLGPAPAA